MSPWTTNHFIKSTNKINLCCAEKESKGMKRTCTDLSQKVRETCPHALLPFQVSAPFPRSPSFSLMTFMWIKHKLSLLFKRSHTLPKRQVSTSRRTAFLLLTTDWLYSPSLQLHKYGHQHQELTLRWTLVCASTALSKCLSTDDLF